MLIRFRSKFGLKPSLKLGLSGKIKSPNVLLVIKHDINTIPLLTLKTYSITCTQPKYTKFN